MAVWALEALHWGPVQQCQAVSETASETGKALHGSQGRGKKESLDPQQPGAEVNETNGMSLK